MKGNRSTFIALMAAAGFAASIASVHGQTVVTPYSPSETGMAVSPSEETALGSSSASVNCETPFSPNECGPAEAPAAGGTEAPALGGIVEGASMGLPATPDSDREAAAVDD
jgi:hypothetical protein